MLFGHAEAGHAGKLDGLLAAMDLNGFSVRGPGCLRIDESCHPPKMIWSLNRRIGLNFHIEDHERIDDSSRILEGFHAEAIALRGASNPRMDSYTSRMKLLQDEAAHDVYVLNLASEIDFKQFVRAASNIRKCNLVLMDNGNLRAIWKDEQGARLGLQFLGGRMVQYVIFKRRQKEQSISRVTGRDSLEGLERQISAFELHSLLYE